MDADTRRKRHAALWSSGTAAARRFAIAGVIFAVLLLLRVVEPYNTLEGERDFELQELKEEQQALAIEEADLPKVEQALEEIQQELNAKPWNAEIASLKAYFRELLRAGQTGRLPVPQDRANESIDNIVTMVNERVITKLETVIWQTNTSERLANFPQKIKDALDDWYDEHYNNTQWYFTVEDKDRTIEGMAQVLNALELEALAAVAESKENIAEEKGNIRDEMAEIDDEIKEVTKGIKTDLNDILPKWAQDSIGVDAMVKFYPWVLLIIAVSLIVRGWSAGRHFHGMADAEGWTAEERSDPLISTPWTLIWRGYWGTAATVANYAAVTLVLLFCLHRAVFPPPYEAPEEAEQAAEMVAEDSVEQTAIEASVQEVADTVSRTIPAEAAYALMIALLAGLLGVPAFRAVSEFQQD